MKEERLINDDAKRRLVVSIQQLKEKITNIENGCARELVVRLRALTSEVLERVDGRQSVNDTSTDTVECMIDTINVKVVTLWK